MGFSFSKTVACYGAQAGLPLTLWPRLTSTVLLPLPPKCYTLQTSTTAPGHYNAIRKKKKKKTLHPGGQSVLMSRLHTSTGEMLMLSPEMYRSPTAPCQHIGKEVNMRPRAQTETMQQPFNEQACDNP